MLRPRFPVPLLALCSLAACGEPPATRALFAVPGASVATEFYDLPYPNDLRRYPDGRLDLSLLPTNSPLVDEFRAAAESLDGFGLSSAMYARFEHPLDPTSLPDPTGSLADGASVYLVDVDPDSPGRGTRIPILARSNAEGYQTLGGNHLAVRPFPGFPLAEGTTYALVITDRVRDADGGEVRASSDFEQVLGSGGDAAIVHARAVYQPLLELLDEPGGDDRGDVVSAAVFTTQHATFVAPALRKGVLGAPAPVAADVTSQALGAFTVFRGAYEAPNFQAGAVPYRTAPDGQITVGGDGAAVVQRMEPMRFTLTVPYGDVPPAGWPLAIYAHGTGGNASSFISDGTAQELALEGIAVISTDQVLHGPRNPGGNPELDFFNFTNVYAARDNALQGYADVWSQLRLATGLALDDGARTHTFDPSRVMFFGHSQGGVTGPGFVAFEPSLRGAVLSGTGGALYLTLLHKTQPIDVPALVEAFVRDAPVDEDNPSLALLQMWIERSETMNYAPLMVRQPPIIEGVQLAGRNVFQTEGFTDTYSPNIGIEAFATALGADLVKTPAQREVPGLTLRGRAALAAPITGNVDGMTAVLGQYAQRPSSDGHFVVFDIPAARTQAAKFLGTLARTGQATVVAP